MLNKLVKFNNKNNENQLVPFHSRYGLGTFDAEFDNLVNRLFDSFWSEPSFTLSRNYRPTEITEDDKNYHVEINLAGFKKDQVKVTKQNNVLKVVAKKDENNQYVRSWQNSEWDINKASVKLEDGLLKINIPKTEIAQEKVIDIEEVK